MNKRLFLEAVRAFLEKRTIIWEEPVTQQEWVQVFKAASQQKVLPMIYQSVYNCEEFKKCDAAYRMMLKKQAHMQLISQVAKTGEFLDLYRSLSEKGLEPVVVKGIICRNLYPFPDDRISGDEDLYIPDGAFEEYNQALLDSDMVITGEDEQRTDLLHEVTYVKNNGLLRIELHKDLFDSDGAAYAGLNELFQNVFENAVSVKIDNVNIRTMGYNDHLLFLIVHAFKHFIHSGVGIRQVCDIVMYGNTYGREIDWDYIMRQCRKINIDVFTASLFDIGFKYLGFSREKSGCPDIWSEIAVDSGEMLDDMLSAGVYGSAETERLHSANITLNAILDGREGKDAKVSVLRTVFLSREKMTNRYTYLNKYPFLLPVAWADRIIKYALETGSGKVGNKAAKSVEIGRQRVDLLKKYKII